MSIRQDILKVLDATAGRAVCRLLPVRARAAGAPSAPPARALVIRPGGIGDAVLLVPLLRALRRAWPDTALDLLVEGRNIGVLGDSGLADRVYRYDRPFADLRRVVANRYDVVIDTEQYHRLSAVIAWLTGAPCRVGFATNDRRRLLTVPVPYSQSLYEAWSFLELGVAATGQALDWDEERPFYPVSDDADRFAEQALAPLAGATAVAIHPGASIPERRWGGEKYAHLARLLSDRGLAIVILGGPQDVADARVIVDALEGRPHVDLAGRCSLMQAAAVVARSTVYVSADSGVLHLAYGVGTPTVHLFGPGVLSKWGPPGSRFRSVKNPVPCSPCTRYGYTPPCCQGMICMRGISPEQVRDAVVRQLEAGHAPALAGGGR